MKKTFTKFAKNPLISGAFLLFTGGMIGNVFNFLFNLYMSRNLRVEDYGVLISLVSIITLLSIPAGAFTPTILTVAGKYFAQNDFPHLHNFYYKTLKPLMLIGIAFLVLFVIFSNFLGNFFHITNPFLLIFSAISVILFYLVTLNNSFLQSKLSFKALTSTSTLAAVIKVMIGVLLVAGGGGLGGAVIGLFISYILPVCIGAFFLRSVIFYKVENSVHISSRELLAYGIPSAVIVFSLNSFISSDILLVKHLFSGVAAGQYAGLSLIGRVIFFLTAPISTVMFPAIINRINTNKEYKRILYSSMLLVGGMSAIVTIGYYAFPEFIVQFFLKNKAYMSVSHDLGRFGVLIAVYSMVSLLTYYFLSIRKTTIMWALLIGAILQVVLIELFHTDFSQIINISIAILILVLLYLFYSFIKTSRNI